MNKIKTFILLLASTFALSGCFDGGSSHGGSDEGGGGNVPSKTTFTLGETFRFDDLDLTFSTEYSCLKIKNSYSDYNGSKVIGLPVTVKNQGSEKNSLNPFLYTQYGSKGTRLNSIGSYFDDDVDWAGHLLPGASYTKSMYFLYDGDGEYKVFFETFKTKITLSFNVTYVEPTPEPEPELDKAFTYEDMELTFSSNYSIVVYQPSQYSNKREVVKMPVTVKNNGTKANHLDYLDMKEIYPGVLGNDDAVYGLPEELARKIEDTCYFPDGLLCTLRKYQEWGVKYILHQENALLGDEMGLGKTVQAIAVMVSLRNTGAKHFVVVCPASVLTNWCREVTKHSKLKVFKVHGAGKINVINAWIRNGGVAVTTYESTAAFLNYPDLVINQIVVDEAHYIKNPEANRSKRTRDLCERSERVLFMTGTALENRVDEMIELISILNPKIAHQISSIAFMSTSQQFREKVAPVYYRRKRNDVLTELPDLIESKEWCTLTPEEERQYEDSVLSKNYMAARRVSWDINDISKSTKANRLLEIIEDAKNDGRKVLVFSFFLDTISKIKQLLGYKCLNPITGALNPARRQEIIDEFDKSEPGTVLLSQIQSGGTGLNIQSASVVVICEPQLKPSIENQAISRAYRMGQSRNVQVFRLLAENTIDERLIEILEEKQEIFNAFADKSVAAEKSLDIDETTFGEIIKEEIERIQKKRGESTENPGDFKENSISDNSQYYDDLMKLSYRDLCEELLNKYGPVKGDYFVNENCRSKNQKISRSKEGLFVHHFDEDKAIMLSEPAYAIKKPFMYQRADRLLYCNLLEHYLLHIKITEESVFSIDNEELVGICGALKLLGRQINDFYGGKIFMQEYMIHATNVIKGDFGSYIKMIRYFWEVIKDHPLYSQMIKKEELALGWDGNLIQKIYKEI